jgi:hypothetical protein
VAERGETTAVHRSHDIEDLEKLTNHHIGSTLNLTILIREWVLKLPLAFILVNYGVGVGQSALGGILYGKKKDEFT